MPTVFRVMKVENGKPKVGTLFGELGVRPNKDIPVNSDGTVDPLTGGLSVGASLYELPPAVVPKRLNHIVQGANGNRSHRVWRLDTGPYEEGLLTEQLNVRIEPDRHGFVEPATTMPLDTYQEALAGTCDDWQIDEE